MWRNTEARSDSGMQIALLWSVIAFSAVGWRCSRFIVVPMLQIIIIVIIIIIIIIIVVLH